MYAEAGVVDEQINGAIGVGEASCNTHYVISIGEVCTDGFYSDFEFGLQARRGLGQPSFIARDQDKVGAAFGELPCKLGANA
ncbi:hypothetical protein GCM10009655_00260 [Rhodoglobus aureus]|uniref:Uncharacterized protein n=1 Tax=Rhodoglobus aureus TaxID=191497 RepID=A0ABP4G0V9_9MICO